MTKMILAGVDSSETSRQAAEVAADLANAFNGELHIISAFDVSKTEEFQVQNRNRSAEQPSAYKKLQDQRRNEALETITNVVGGLTKKFPELTITSAVVQGAPGFALVNVAEEILADVIVVGNNRVQVSASILNSIARTVSSEANCDLYIANTLGEADH